MVRSCRWASQSKASGVYGVPKHCVESSALVKTLGELHAASQSLMFSMSVDSAEQRCAVT